MEISIKTKQILNALLILAWVIFIGICIEAGAFITNAVFVLVKPEIVPHLWQQADLSNLFQYDQGYFFVVVLLMSITTIMKAFLFFLIIKILHAQKLNMPQLFNLELKRFFFRIAYLALFIGLFSLCSINYSEWLISKGVKMPDAQSLHAGGGDVWLFMSVTLFVIAQIFKKGIEIQTENELTI